MALPSNEELAEYVKQAQSQALQEEKQKGRVQKFYWNAERQTEENFHYER